MSARREFNFLAADFHRESFARVQLRFDARAVGFRQCGFNRRHALAVAFAQRGKIGLHRVADPISAIGAKRR